jgi:hypothetical protein
VHIWLGTPVKTSDEVEVGRVDKLVVHPASWKILRVIVRRGSFLNRSEVDLRLNEIERASAASTWLRIDDSAFAQLPTARASERQRPPKDWLTPLGWAPDRVYWPAGYDGAVYPEITAGQLKGWGTLRTPIAADSAVPANGPDVLAQDGRKVGESAQVILDASTHELQCVLFRGDEGLWPRSPTELPASWVAKHDRWSVSLVFDLDTIRALVRDAIPVKGLTAAGSRLQRELLRQQTGQSLFDVDPYDILARWSETGFETPIERDEASVINPQPRPGTHETHPGGSLPARQSVPIAVRS